MALQVSYQRLDRHRNVGAFSVALGLLGSALPIFDYTASPLLTDNNIDASAQASDQETMMLWVTLLM